MALLRSMAPDGAPREVTIRLNGPIEAGAAEAVRARLSEAGLFAKPVVHIDSEGGIYHEAMTIYHALMDRPYPAECHAGGRCSSAAVIILLAGAVRTARPWTKFVLHAPALTEAAGRERLTAGVVTAVGKNLAEAEGHMVRVLRERAHLSLSSVRKVMRGETRLNAEQACQWGLVHRVLEKWTDA
ncbi:ATP-dependent Clp protease proteolytic subunit [Parvibaculum sp.]|uniref:ATP-dependent Clp protease proteolytic subunit n=1 Tax=Parvibaculum sp. TaxID=2024848 RepID=UPI001B0B3192|nr:ATP-dependent Clp protease proteolytic subunit [Parvibaculum sp.]MBO6634428.1 ATP-dependent Clp protease proteolytic subunit [Parvibaculum sp.]MBO6679163.1 ATP-dependent Clp protease proteolytic subunit [Parvibaculum sp.]MBO6685650.1 ATP-dependent Clp protease proteolytic subunit [Parvibaculum sp.]MBO6905795.1 ATP-dependent Clp protease proteolytic subunit [Parvibaculum sp.]